MTAFIWTVVVMFALEAGATCINLARGVEPSKADRAVGAAVGIGMVAWGVYVVAGVVAC